MMPTKTTDASFRRCLLALLAMAAVSLALWGSAPASSADTGTLLPANAAVYVDGKYMSLRYDQLLIKDDRMFIPFRIILQEIGATVDWNERTGLITASKGDNTLRLLPGSNQAWVNQRTIRLQQPALLHNDTTYVPLRFVSEHFGAVVSWNSTDRKALIAASTGAAFGQLAPTFRIESRGGDIFDLAQADKPTYIFFWASWCPYCKQQFSAIEQLYQEYGDRIHFVGLNNIFNDSDKGADKTIADYNLTFPMYYVEDKSIGKAYKQSAVPSHFFITKDGIYYKDVIGSYGDSTYEYHKKILDELLTY